MIQTQATRSLGVESIFYEKACAELDSVAQ